MVRLGFQEKKIAEMNLFPARYFMSLSKKETGMGSKICDQSVNDPWTKFCVKQKKFKISGTHFLVKQTAQL